MKSITKIIIISVLFSIVVSFLSNFFIFLYESYNSYGSINILNIKNVIYFVIQSSLLFIFQLIVINFLIGVLLKKYKIDLFKQKIIYSFLVIIYFIIIFYLTDFRLIVINPT